MYRRNLSFSSGPRPALCIYAGTDKEDI